MANEQMRVNPDGIKLGWNVVALVASVGFGVYISTIVGPIQSDNVQQARQLTEHKTGIDTLNSKLRDLELDVVRLKLEVENLKREQTPKYAPH